MSFGHCAILSNFDIPTAKECDFRNKQKQEKKIRYFNVQLRVIDSRLSLLAVGIDSFD